MDKLSIELAKGGLADANWAHSPRYNAIRDALLGRLSTNGQFLDGLREREAHNRRNFALVTGLVGQLPRAYVTESEQREIAVGGPHAPYLARQVQANTFWLYPGYLSRKLGELRYFESTPYYIVGKRPNIADAHRKPGKEATDLLLVNALNLDHHGLLRATVWDKQFGHRYEAAKLAAGREFENPTLEGMFVPNADLDVRITHIDAPLKAAHNTNPHHGLPAPAAKIFDSLPPALYGAFYAADPDEVFVGFEEERTITDQDLASYDVNTRLYELAIAFDKADVLTNLYNQYKAQLTAEMQQTNLGYEQLTIF